MACFWGLFWKNQPKVFLVFFILLSFWDVFEKIIQNSNWHFNLKNIWIFDSIWLWVSLRLITRSTVDFMWKPLCLYGDVRCNLPYFTLIIVLFSAWFLQMGLITLRYNQVFIKKLWTKKKKKTWKKNCPYLISS